MKAKHLQVFLACIFLGLGGWCLLFPSVVEQLVFRPDFVTDTLASNLLIGCFGAQAVLVGIVVLTSTFQPKTFLIFGCAGSIPFFAFNYYFYTVQPVFSEWMLLDFVGNLGIFICGIYGYQLAKRELASKPLQ